MFADIPLEAALPASDLERARKWYSEKLGLEPVTEDPYGGLRYESGGARFQVYLSEYAGTNQATAASFHLANFDDTVKALKARGVEFEEVDFGEMGSTVDGVIASPDGQDKAAWFKDSEGNILAVSTVSRT